MKKLCNSFAEIMTSDRPNVVRFNVIVLAVSMGILMLLLFSGCNITPTDSEEVIKDGRATVRLNMIVPDSFDDIMFIEFTNVENENDEFSVTLSEHNGYGVLLSMPTGSYNVTSHEFLSGENYLIDIKELKVYKPEEYDIDITIYPDGTDIDKIIADKEVSVNEEIKTSIVIIAGVGILLLVVIVVVIIAVINKRRRQSE